MRMTTLATGCTLAALIGATPSASSQEADRWRYYPPSDVTPSGRVDYGGTEGEDTWISLSCLLRDGIAEVSAYIVVRTEGFAEGAAVPLTFYGPAWSADLPVVVDGPGLYESVTARFGFTPEAQLFRSLFTNVGTVSYRLRADLAPEVADLSAGRIDVLAFMEDCAATGAGADETGATPGPTTQDAVLQP